MSLSRDEAIAAFQRQYGVSLETATAMIDRSPEYRPVKKSAAGEEIAPEIRDRLEKAEQREVVKLYRAMGCTVYSLSQARASKQTPGLPDLWVVHTGVGAAWWHEVKRPDGGVQSEPQKRFQRECQECHERYLLGGLAAAEDALERLGIANRDETGQLVPARPWIQIAQDEEAKRA